MIRQLIAFKDDGSVFVTLPYAKGNTRRTEEGSEHFTRSQAREEMKRLAEEQGIKILGYYSEPERYPPSDARTTKRIKRRTRQKQLRDAINTYKIAKRELQSAEAKLINLEANG